MSERAEDDVVIVGAGHAGGATALALRDLGHRGRITLVGAEAHPPYERPSLSKELLTGVYDAPHALAEPARWRALGIRMELGKEAVALDSAVRTVWLDDGSALPYRFAVLATGGRPRGLPGLDGSEAPVLRDLDDVARLRSRAAAGGRAVIVGGGVIGLEAACSLQSLGMGVTVVEQAGRLMTRAVPADMAERMATIHHEAGTDLRLGRRVAASRAVADGTTLTLDDGQSLQATLVLVAIGILPADGIARAAGLACDAGVLVDADYVSSDPAVLAVGDVARPPSGRQESWAHAGASARAAARSILALAPEPPAIPWFWTVQHGRTLRVAGDTTGPAQARGEVSLYLDDGMVTGAAAIDGARAFAAARRLIGRRIDLAPAANCVS